ncbi:MAG: hypothetical protein J07HQW2_03887 [Haloquadratum walsbyi J07HQW2]|uniref:Uncharacterized protein n=1 Tax=Haloquadratum walsbyi J07HQW2 TaxID=1238425 RepID=U1PY44_9EURY|nr:MAG: hypothetical protein J07HQW2_03887 [Haloquadratum walsbyi J07HQW2]
MPDRLDDKDILVSVSRDDCSVVAGAELVVRVAGELFEAVGGPVFRLVEFLDQSLLGFGVESVQQIECF